MPSVYLSPSTQEYNPYITGAGSEEYFMNLITDAMEPYLTANTIRFGRNTPEMTAASSIRQGNAGNYDFYLALHSNGSTDGSREGTVRGVIAFYYPGSANGQRAADIFVRNLKTIYPLPEKVYTRSTTALGEVRQPRMPAVLLELGYHDNYADARWVQNNIQAIAAKLQALAVELHLQASDDGHLFGSVTDRMIADAIAALGVTVSHQRIHLDSQIRSCGEYVVAVKLHQKVIVDVKVNVVRA